MESSPGRRRRIVFIVLLVLLLWGVAELIAWTGLSILHRRVVGWGELAREQAEVLGVETDADAPEASDATGPSANEDEDFFLVQGTVREDLRAPQVLHPYLGYVLDQTFKRRHIRTHPEAANLGFPHSHHPLIWRPADDRVVVGVFGGSLANQLVVMGHRTLVNELGALPAYRGKRIIIVNLALPGQKQPQQLMTLNYVLALGGHLDVIVNIDGFNEMIKPIRDNLTFGVHPIYPRTWRNQAAAVDGELRKVFGEIYFLHDRRRARAMRFVTAPWRFSSIAGLIFTAGDGIDAKRIAELEEARGEFTLTDSFQAVGPAYDESDEAQIYADLIDIWRRSSVQMHALAMENGIDYHHFLQPNQYDPGSKKLSAHELKLTEYSKGRYRKITETAYPLLRQVGSEMCRDGVTFHDASGVFREETDTYYIDDCCHLNRRGNNFLAKAVVETIGEALDTPPCTTPRPPAPTTSPSSSS
ncbi:MAG: hypothetical protein AAGD38_00620 [Acidobacteriota bacterium]